jgi:hypothetical protein
MLKVRYISVDIAPSPFTGLLHSDVLSLLIALYAVKVGIIRNTNNFWSFIRLIFTSSLHKNLQTHDIRSDCKEQKY